MIKAWLGSRELGDGAEKSAGRPAIACNIYNGRDVARNNFSIGQEEHV